jgi:hypothetical protein
VRGKGLQRRKGMIGVMDFSRRFPTEFENSKYYTCLFSKPVVPHRFLIKSYKKNRQKLFIKLIPQLSDELVPYSQPGASSVQGICQLDITCLLL